LRGEKPGFLGAGQNARIFQKHEGHWGAGALKPHKKGGRFLGEEGVWGGGGDHGTELCNTEEGEIVIGGRGGKIQVGATQELIEQWAGLKVAKGGYLSKQRGDNRRLLPVLGGR